MREPEGRWSGSPEQDREGWRTAWWSLAATAVVAAIWLGGNDGTRLDHWLYRVAVLGLCVAVLSLGALALVLWAAARQSRRERLTAAAPTGVTAEPVAGTPPPKPADPDLPGSS